MKIVNFINIVFGLSLFLPFNAYASEYKNEDWEYSIRYDEVTLEKYIGEEQDNIEIPDEIDGYEVTGIIGAFKGNTDLITITIPENIKYILYESFANCTNLNEVVFETDDLEIIGPRAFDKCKNLTEIEIPDSVKEIGNGAFWGTNLSEIALPTELEKIGTLVPHDEHKSEIEDDEHLNKIVNNSNINIPFNSFSNVRERRLGYFWFFDEAGEEEVTEKDGLVAGATAYRLEKKPDLDKYIDEYDKVLSNIHDTGISIDDANTVEEVYDYILSLCPQPEDESINISIDISYDSPIGGVEFKPAQNGNKNNPKGKRGRFGVTVTFEDTITERTEEIKFICYIIPNEYKKESDDEKIHSRKTNGKNSVSKLTRSFSDPDNILTSRPNVNNGTWEKADTSWKLKLNNNTYAYSQWAYIDGNWYYIDDTEKVATGWQKVNGKWYYLHTDGAMRTSWQNIDNEWFYFNDNGEMVTGQQNINGIDYYFDVDGKMINQ